jgi:hypothetical protein
LVAAVASAGIAPVAYSAPFAAPFVAARSAPLVAAASPYYARSAVVASPYVASPYIANPYAQQTIVRSAPLLAQPAPVYAKTVAAPLVAAPVIARSAPLVAAAPVIAKSAEFDAYPQYQYAYNVNDALTGDNKAQEESREGDVVRGSYSLVEADGSIRKVNYYADPINGFNAVVSKSAPVVVAEPVAARVVVA